MTVAGGLTTRSGHVWTKVSRSDEGDRLEGWSPLPRHFYPHGEGDRRGCSLLMEKAGDGQWEARAGDEQLRAAEEERLQE